MKLPDDKKERTQILVLIGLGVAFVAAGLYFGIGWIVDFKKGKQVKIEELGENIRKANLEIDQRPKDEKIRKDALIQISASSEKYFLHPTLGSFLLPAIKKLTGHFEAVGLAIENKDVREAGTIELAGDKNSPFFMGYVVHVSTVCSYRNLIRLLREVESANPFIAVTSVSIASRPEDPEKHSCQFDVQWMIWRDPEMPSKLASQVEAAMGSNKGGAE